MTGPTVHPPQTLARPVRLEGTGLHTGAHVVVEISPLPSGSGIQFLLPGLDQPFRAGVEILAGTARCTSLAHGERTVHTVEHLLAALAASRIDNCLVRVHGGEIPALDGSALPFMAALREAGIQAQTGKTTYWRLKSPVWVEEGGSTLIALPCDGFHITCAIDFGVPELGKQVYSITLNQETFASEIAPARTFGFLHEVEELRRRGLARGGSLENAVVFDKTGPLTPLRFPDEPVRHKILDLVGDLALLGQPLLAHVVAIKPSHRLNTMLVRQILDTESSRN